MRIEPEAVIASHLYRLEIHAENAQYDYATILEMHHPAYLSYADLKNIYKQNDSVEGAGAAVRKDLSLILSAERILAELELSLGE
jgi:hypothetical protein